MSPSPNARLPCRGAISRHARFLAGPALVLALSGAPSSYAQQADITDLSLEQLVNVDVYSASKFNQKAADAPASITVITREDIKTYGYRTLADIMRSVRGMFVHYDRIYNYIGVRGLAPPGDYNSRMLVLVDGHRANDNVFDQAFIGTDAIIDIDLIDRVEFVRGPSSSLYGGNAFFGVINIVTRRAGSMPNAELAIEGASYRTGAARATLAKTFESGAEMVLSASKMRSRGADRYYPDLDSPATNNGRATGADSDRNQRFYGRYSLGGFSVAAGSVTRTKGIGNGLYGADFNDPGSTWTDSSSFIDGSYTHALSERVDIEARLSYGEYQFRGNQTFAGIVNRNTVDGSWWTGEAKLNATLSTRHRVVGGFEAQQNTRQDQRQYDVAPYFIYLDDKRTSNRIGFYAQDDYAWTDRLSTSLGVRHDRLATYDQVTSPRLGAVYKASALTTIKLLHGTAFRAPNVYELYAVIPGVQIDSPNLKPEKIRSSELVLEQYLGKNTRFIANAYAYNIKNLIGHELDPVSGLLQFQNVESVNARGIEFELEHVWAGGTRARGSAGLQSSRDGEGNRFTNSPRQLYKANFSAPLGIAKLRVGSEWQYVGARDAELGKVAAYHIVNLNLHRDPGKRGFEWSLGIYNLLGQRFFDPIALDPTLSERDRMLQNGRTVRLQIVAKF